MKKILLIFTILFSIHQFALSNNYDEFNVDISAIEKRFETLNQFEKDYFENKAAVENLEMITEASTNATPLMKKLEIINRSNYEVLGIPSPLCGFFMGPVGIATENSKKQLSDGAVAVVIVAGVIFVGGITYYALASSGNQQSADVCANACAEVALQVAVEACFLMLEDVCNSMAASACESNAFLLLKML